MPELTLVEAINLALARAMDEDANIVVLGEDGMTTRKPGIWASMASVLSE